MSARKPAAGAAYASDLDPRVARLLERMTLAEKEVLEARSLSGVRLSCQILCDDDMNVRCISRLEGSGRADAGKRPTDQLQPAPAVYIDKDDLNVG